MSRPLLRASALFPAPALIGLWMLTAPILALAAEDAVAPAPSLTRSSLTAEQATDYATGLLLVLALLALLMWAARWIQSRNGFGRGGMRVLSNLALGGKERLMVVDVNGERLLIGVAPGGVALIRTLDSPDSPPITTQTHDQNWLTRTLSRSVGS